MNRRTFLPSLLSLLLFSWFTVLVVSYFVYHKPFTPELALHLAASVARGLIAVAIVSIAGGLGRRLFPMPELSPLRRLSLQAALGLGMLGAAWLVIGAAGGLHPWIGWPLTALMLAGLHRSGREWCADWRGWTVMGRESGRLGKSLLVIISGLFLVTLPVALSPPVKFDALVYHLTLPQMYMDAGRFYYVPEIMFWGMPQTGELLYTWGMLLGGARVPLLLGWLFGLLAVTGVVGLTGGRFGADAGMVAAAALTGGYTLADALSWGYVDWLVMLFGVGWLIALEAWAGEKQWKWLVLAGLAAGMAMGTKYTAGVLLLCGVLVILWLERCSLRRAAAMIALYAAIFIAAAAPWLVKNLVATGNPVYPLLFPSGAMTSLRLEIYQSALPAETWINRVLLLPLQATFSGVEGAIGYSASIGPLLFGLSLCAPLAWSVASAEGRRTLKIAAVTAMSGVAFWMVTARIFSYMQQSRLHFVLFPALAVLAGAGYVGLRSVSLPGVRLGRIAGVLIVLVAGLNLFDQAVRVTAARSPQAALGVESDADYLDHNLGWYAPALRAARELPAGAHTLLLFEPRSYYCRPGCNPDEVLDRWHRERRDKPGSQTRSNQEIVEDWKAQGYTHLLFYRAGANHLRSNQLLRYSQADWEALDALIASLEEVQHFGTAYTLYILGPAR